MSYELVDPAYRYERGAEFGTTEAAIAAGRAGDEVWQLADDRQRTRVCHVHTVAAAPVVDEVRAKRIARGALQYRGRAEREASALIAESTFATSDSLHSLVALAWLRGCMAGYEAGIDILNATRTETVTPTTGGSK